MARPSAASTLFILAGVNGAGKSSIGGANLRSRGYDYFNPDEVARGYREKESGLSQADANGRAWLAGKLLLEKAILNRTNFVLESTLGANTIPNLLLEAAQSGILVHIWYAGLSSPELHIARVAARVRAGGHPIPEADIRRRYDKSRENLIGLMPCLAELHVYDNSAEWDMRKSENPPPARLVLHMEEGKILGPTNLAQTPAWAKPIVAAAMKMAN